MILPEAYITLILRKYTVFLTPGFDRGKYLSSYNQAKEAALSIVAGFSEIISH